MRRYSLGAIVLHWVLALALAFQLSLGLGLDYVGRSGFAQYQLHKSVGITVLLLSLLRVLWRLTHRRPPSLEGGFNGFLAKAVHFGLYVFMIGAPLTGWLLVSTDKVKVPTLLFGTVHWPHLPAPDSVNGFAHESHELLGWLGMTLILLHVAGAVRHQWLLRDNLMARMAPARGLWLLLALLLPVGWALGVMEIKKAGPPQTPTETPVAPVTEPVAPAPAPAAEPGNAAVAAPETPVAPPKWTVKPGGTLAFSVTNGADKVRGQFGKWSSDIVFDPDRPEGARIAIRVDLGSASVGDPTQDAMLASADFLDTAAHPGATYRSTSVRMVAPNRYAAKGTLSLRGKSRPQDVVFTLSGTGLSRHVEGSAVINRAGFEIGTGETAQGLAPTVQLTFSFDATGRPGDGVKK
ncbi:MAG: cytochrome b/b6 domain-containing protein [Novosphingobium sp.]|nr:cytochrome b/b6 domain-containing protein [Novosphingobium sp.]